MAKKNLSKEEEKFYKILKYESPVDEYYKKSGQLIKCFNCGCDKLLSASYSIGGHIAEESYSCSECKSLLGFYAYGQYDHFYREWLSLNIHHMEISFKINNVKDK